MSQILQIALQGNPILKSRAAEAEFPLSTDHLALAEDLMATMVDANAVGLAAPQVFHSVRMFVMRSRRGIRFPDAPEITPFIVVNPVVLSASEETRSGWEGCYSFPGYRALIMRPYRITAQWQDVDGTIIEKDLVDLAARVFLHEMDHLDGIMFFERMRSPSDLYSEEEMLRYCERTGGVTL